MQKLDPKYLSSLVSALEATRVPHYERLMAQVDFPEGFAKVDFAHKLSR